MKTRVCTAFVMSAVHHRCEVALEQPTFDPFTVVPSGTLAFCESSSVSGPTRYRMAPVSVGQLDIG